MRISNRGGAIEELSVENLDFLVQYLARRSEDWDFFGRKTDVPHGDGDQLSVILKRHGDLAAGNFDGEIRLFDEALVIKEARENAQAVAGFFGFRAIGVKNAQTELAFLRGQWTPKNTVGADAEIAVAHDADLLDRWGWLPQGEIAGIEDNVVVTEGVVFVKSHVGNRRARRKMRR